MGRTPIPVAESTRQPPEREIPTLRKMFGEEGPEYEGEPMDTRQMRGYSAERNLGLQGRGEPEWALPKPTESCRPPREGIAGRGNLPAKLIDQRGNFLDKSILPQNSDWWKLISDVGESWLPWQGTTL